MKRSLVLTAALLFAGKTSGQIYPDTNSYPDTNAYPADTNSYGGGYGTDTNYYAPPDVVYTYARCVWGDIHMFYGDTSDIPQGYQVCDGSNMTPDLSNRFPIGASKDYPLLSKGGASQIYLSVDQLPSHYHLINKEEVVVTDAGKHYHKSWGKLTSSGTHNHNEGDLVTENAGTHTHTFSASTNGGGHAHTYDLNADNAGVHNHGVELATAPSGDHKHDNDFAVQQEGSAHGHDIEVKVEGVGDHSHKVNLDDFEIKVADHVHGVGTIKPDDHYFKHYHNLVGAITSTSDKHKHGFNAETTSNGNHGHVWDFNTDEQGDHCHDDGSLKALNAGDHIHTVEEQDTESAGCHDHTFDAFLETTYNTEASNEDFNVALDKVDKGMAYKQTVSEDEGHTHGIPATETCSAGDHSHDVDGKTGDAGKHKHDVTGSIDNNGDHVHQIDTDTQKAGDHGHKVSGKTNEVDVTLDHDMSGCTAPGGAFDVTVQHVCGSTAAAGKHTHDASATTTSPGLHTHDLTGCVKENGIHSHPWKGTTGDAGKHDHKVTGTIGGDHDGKHSHDISGTTEDGGIHSHKITGFTGTNGDHCHDIDISLDTCGSHKHSAYGKSERTGNGASIDITPPYVAVYFICCVDESDSSDPFPDTYYPYDKDTSYPQ